jgi:hypothetical protein
MNRLAIAALLLVPLIAHGQIYKSVDENGNTVYSDTPPIGGGEVESVDLPAINRTLPPPDIPSRVQQEPKEEAVKMSIAIVSPAEDAVIPVGAAGNFSVSAELNTPLTGGAQVQLLMDGVAIETPQSILSWSLTNVFRGSHILTIDILDESGSSLAVSEPVTIHVRRPSKNF